VGGPLAGDFASRQSAPLSLEPVTPQIDRNGMPLAFDIGVGVSRLHPQLRDEIDRVLRRKRAEIGRVLDDFGIPRVARPAAGGEHGG
jgi:mxaJ protein